MRMDYFYIYMMVHSAPAKQQTQHDIYKSTPNRLSYKPTVFFRLRNNKIRTSRVRAVLQAFVLVGLSRALKLCQQPKVAD